MQALRSEILEPSGVEYSTSLKLAPTSIVHGTQTSPGASTSALPRYVCNLVVARSNRLRIFEIVEENAPLREQSNTGKEKIRKDTEAVEGEAEMDTQGEGFVFMGAVKVFKPSHDI
jgi:cleavage and polyadenylation specificity factor subunit 1